MITIPDLQTALLDLLHEVEGTEIRPIIGGGYGIYLRIEHVRRLDVRTLLREWPEPRSTNDLDLFLRPELLIDSSKLEPLAVAIARLGYQVVPGAEKYQFVKPGPGGIQAGSIKLDILTGPQSRFKGTKVKTDTRRARPHPSVGIHAHPVDETPTLEDGLLPIKLEGKLRSGEPGQAEVLLPHPYTFLMMKLFAFRDRLDDADKEFGRYHALDLYSILATTSEMEWREALGFRDCIKAKGYPIKSLVAFSGTVLDDKVPGLSYTEEGMNNGVREKELPEKFGTPEYQVLLVAEKYQTGFDQPLLHTMYVDKRLAGIQAVQSLSRLNRTHPLKEDAFVLDFVNDREEIREAFKSYYEGAEMGEEVDPALMYQIKGELDSSGIYLSEEVQRFCEIYFKPTQRQSAADHQAMNAALDPSVDRFGALQQREENEAELWRGKLYSFRNLYAFLSQIIPYQDSDLEKLYVFLRHLAPKLARRRRGPAYNFDDEVRLEYYRLQKISEGSISLKDGYARPLDGPAEVGTGMIREGPVALSFLIGIINQRFGTNFNQADQLFFDQIVETATSDEALKQAAVVNPKDKFELVFKNLLETLFVERMDQNEEIFARFMNDPAFQKVVTNWLASEAYQRLRHGERRT